MKLLLLQLPGVLFPGDEGELSGTWGLAPPVQLSSAAAKVMALVLPQDERIGDWEELGVEEGEGVGGADGGSNRSLETQLLTRMTGSEVRMLEGFPFPGGTVSAESSCGC